MSGDPKVSILDPEEQIRVRPSGAVGSVQEAEITVERGLLERIWNVDSLELMARAYWAFLRRMSLGIIRVEYAATLAGDEEADAGLDHVRLIAKVEVENFYPGIRGRGRFSRFGAWFYAQTQLRIHVIVCNAYLRSLPRLDFPTIDRTEMPSDQPREAA